MAIETRARTPQPQFGRFMGIAEIRLEKIGGLGRGRVGVPIILAKHHGMSEL